MLKKIATIEDNPEFEIHIRKQILNFDYELQKCDFVIAARLSKNLDPIQAGLYFTACIKTLENLMQPHINCFSRTRWFYYLRRLPNSVFQGDLRSTMPNLRAIAEIYSLSSTKDEAAQSEGNLQVFKVDSALIRHLARFVAFVFYVNDLQVAYRCAGKSLGYGFSSRHHDLKALPHKVKISEIQSAIEIYDQRENSKSRENLAIHTLARQAGAGYKGTVGKEADTQVALWLITEEQFIPIAELHETYLKGYSNSFPADGMMRLKYGPIKVDLNTVFASYRTEPLINHPPSRYTLHSLATAMIADSLLARLPVSTIRVSEVGYFLVDAERWNTHAAEIYPSVRRKINYLIPKSDLPDEFSIFSAFDLGLKPSPWPIRHGSPIRKVGELVYVDMWAAGNAFLNSYFHPKDQGPIANGRAFRFEDDVQVAIDGTPWAPDERLRNLRQLPLKYADGKTITDIDAIAMDGDHLLIVSCKSIIYSSEYDKGEYNVIRNCESTVVKGKKHWDQIVKTLTDNRKGQNFDFSAFTKISGIVCTPFVIYTSDSDALSEIMPGLRSVSSIGELANWLSLPKEVEGRN